MHGGILGACDTGFMDLEHKGSVRLGSPEQIEARRNTRALTEAIYGTNPGVRRDRNESIMSRGFARYIVHCALAKATGPSPQETFRATREGGHFYTTIQQKSAVGSIGSDEVLSELARAWVNPREFPTVLNGLDPIQIEPTIAIPRPSVVPTALNPLRHG